MSEVGRRLVGVLRAEDTAARLGGDEFIVLLPRSGDGAAVEQVARKILERVRAPIELQEETLFVTGSIGISRFPQDGTDPETLLRNADIAMYRAKEQGGNTFELFTTQMDERLSHRYGTQRAPSRARAGRVLAVLSAVWRTETSGSSASRRPALESPRAGRAPPTDSSRSRRLHRSCSRSGSGSGLRVRAVPRLADEGLPVEWVSVNLSARQCQQASFPETVARILQEQRYRRSGSGSS